MGGEEGAPEYRAKNNNKRACEKRPMQKLGEAGGQPGKEELHMRR